MLHSDVESYGIANPYRPGTSNNDSMHRLRIELRKLIYDNIGTIILGNLNTSYSATQIFE